MSEFQIFGLIAVLLVLAFGANRLFRITRIPDLVVLLVTGLVLGPVLHWVNPDEFRTFTQILGSLALILILFEGGMELNLREGLRHFPGGIVLAFFGYGLAFAAVAASAHWTLWLPWKSALLLGAVFGCTSSTVVMPVLQQLSAREPVKATLLLESALGDVIGVLTVSSLLGLSGTGGPISGFMSGFAREAGIAVVVGVVAGFLWWRLWPKVASQRFSNTVAFGIVLGIYAATHAVGGSGLLAVLAVGLMLGNLPARAGVAEQEIQFLKLSFRTELSGALFLRPHPTAGPGRGSLEDLFHLVIVIPIQTSDLLRFFRTLQLSSDKAVLRTVPGLDAQPTIGPELSLAAEPVRGLHQCDQAGRPNRTDAGNLT